MTGKGEPEQGTNCVSQQVPFMFSMVTIPYLFGGMSLLSGCTNGLLRQGLTPGSGVRAFWKGI